MACLMYQAQNLCPQQVVQNTCHLGLLKGRGSHTDLTNQADEAQLGDPQHTRKGCRSTT